MRAIATEAILTVQIKEAGYPEQPKTIKDICFSIQPRELVGLIGPNGAGKSTTIKAILGLLKDVDGQVQIGGQEGRYAFVPEQPVYYEELTLWEHVELVASCIQLEREKLIERAESLLERFRMNAAKHHLPSGFSKGMQQKLMLIIAFLLQPDLYIVDEPFVGLDPLSSKEFLRLMQEERERGAGILMSTHVLDTAERICDRFLLVSAGSIVVEGTLRDIQLQCGLEDATLLDCFENLLENER